MKAICKISSEWLHLITPLIFQIIREPIMIDFVLFVPVIG